MIDTVAIPEERKSVLIGKKGSIKNTIEKRTKTGIKINDIIEITGEALDVLKAKSIVKAIGRGFSPHRALLLLNEDYELIIINLGGETQNSLKRISSRLIGRKGFTRRKIEESTGAFVSVYGKTVGIIGTYQQASMARKAIEFIIEGRSHGFVYSRLEKK